jgi:hypothetical protein
MNRHRSEKPLQGGLDACPTRIVGDVGCIGYTRLNCKKQLK